MSDKPIAERMQVKADRRLAVIDAPDGLDAVIGVPDRRTDAAQADIVLLFVPDRAAFDRALPAALNRIAPTAILWVAYPKLTSRRAADLNRDILRTAVLAQGLDTASQIAIDEDWSALRLKRSA